MNCSRYTPVEELLRLRRTVGSSVISRLEDFSRLWRSGTEEELFAEFVFCLLTPQSRARSCWDAVEDMRSRGTLVAGSAEDVLLSLNKVRFKYKKSVYVAESRKLFLLDGMPNVRGMLCVHDSPEDMRNWLVGNVKGMGLKEAGHFLRNIGVGGDLAILDRHILKNLVCLGTIEEIPISMTPARYYSIEKSMKEFSCDNGIPMAELDLLLWYKEAGEVFK